MANAQETKLVINQHYDESVEVNDSEEIASLYSPTPRKTPTGPLERPTIQQKLELGDGMADQQEESDDVSLNEFDVQQAGIKGRSGDGKSQHAAGQSNFSEGDSDDSESTSEDDDDDDNTGVVEGAYDPADYEHLTVSQEIKELFQYITRYTPQSISLEHKLKPFNPDYIPAVGDIDAFLKVPRPDGKPVSLGLTVLDEPCAKQSDPTVLDLQLRSISKTTGIRPMQVRSVKDADKNPKAIDSWVESIDELRRSKPPPTVHYSKSMPDIDNLMQEWPPEVEAIISNLQLPTASLDVNLQTYVDLICSILDIPVHKSRVQSLHVLFSLYSAFKEMQQFQTDPVSNSQELGRGGEADVLKFD